MEEKGLIRNSLFIKLIIMGKGILESLEKEKLMIVTVMKMKLAT